MLGASLFNLCFILLQILDDVMCSSTKVYENACIKVYDNSSTEVYRFSMFPFKKKLSSKGMLYWSIQAVPFLPKLIVYIFFVAVPIHRLLGKIRLGQHYRQFSIFRCNIILLIKIIAIG